MYISPEFIYKKIYKLLENVTPLRADCGELCGKSCCEGDDETGMYLFPFEEVMFNGCEKYGITIEESDFYVEGNAVSIALCKGICNRKYRPLSCRIFPLIMHNGEIKLDRRGFSVCPLVKYNDINALDENFVLTVTKVYNILSKIKEIRPYIKETSDLIDEFSFI